jgi:hypothetical protein
MGLVNRSPASAPDSTRALPKAKSRTALRRDRARPGNFPNPVDGTGLSSGVSIYPEAGSGSSCRCNVPAADKGWQVTADVRGPAWALEGLGVRSGRYLLAVEGPVMRAVDRLGPGVSTVTRYIRYHSMHAAIAAHAEQNAWDITVCRRSVRRSEVLLAALQHHAETPGMAGPRDRPGAARLHGRTGPRANRGRGATEPVVLAPPLGLLGSVRGNPPWCSAPWTSGMGGAEPRTASVPSRDRGVLRTSAVARGGGRRDLYGSGDGRAGGSRRPVSG